MKAGVLVLALFAALAGTVLIVFRLFAETDLPLPSGHMLWAFILGALGSVIVSLGLFGLLFWSARKGRDEIDHRKI
ncbi:MAG: hypothetical protein AAGB25_01735 [Pseudomonadota bacterium]